MSRLILSLCFITMTINSFSQTILSSQADVDDYANREDNQYVHYLVITDDDIIDLSPLTGKITSVTQLEIKYADNIKDFGTWEVSVVSNNDVDRVVIYGNDNLESMDGLKIQKAEDFFVMYNPSLKDIDAEIDTLRSINIEWNSSLQALSGLHDVYLSGRGFWSGPDDGPGAIDKPALGIIENNSLTNISGLKNIVALDNIVISGNDELSNLGSVSNINSTDKIVISYNESLTTIDGIDSVSCDYLSITGNEQLQSLQGLNKITFKDVKIEGNHSIENLIGLSDTRTYEFGKIEILNNENLISFTGFNGVEARELIINGNASLKTVSGAKFNEITDVYINNSIVEDYTDLAGFGATDIHIENNPSLIRIIHLFEQEETIDTIANKFGDLFIRENPKLFEIEGNGQINSRLDIEITKNDSLEIVDLSVETPVITYIQYMVSNNSNLRFVHFGIGWEVEIGFNSESFEVEIDSINYLRMEGSPGINNVTVNNNIRYIYDFGDIKFDGEGNVENWYIRQGKLPQTSELRIETMRIESTVTSFNHCYNIESVEYKSNDFDALLYLHSEEVTISNTNTSLEGLPAFLDTKILSIGGASLTSLQGLSNQDLHRLEIKASGIEHIKFVPEDSVKCFELEIWSNSDLTKISGISNLLSDGDTADFEIDWNSKLEVITLGPNSDDYSGRLDVHDNRSLSVCCSLSDWKDDLDLSRNDGICSITNIESFKNSCDLPVFIYRDQASDTVEISNAAGSNEFAIPNNSPGNYIIEIINANNDSVTLSSDNVTLETISSRKNNTSVKYQFSDTQINWKDQGRIKFQLEGSLNGLSNVSKSFEGVVLPNPILFIDCGEPDFQNFANVIRNAYEEGQPAYRFNRIKLEREDNLEKAIDNTLKMNEKYSQLKERFSENNLGFNIDIVAFGEAGLYARRIITELNIEPGKFITINTPHSGSELVASRRSIDDLTLIYVGLLLEGAALSTGVGGAIVEEIVVSTMEELIGKITDEILVASNAVLLEPSSDLIQNLESNFPLDFVGKHSIVSSYNFEEHPKNNTEVPQSLQKQYMMYSYLSFICANATINSIAGPDNDTFISKYSASGGLPLDAVTFVEADHGNLDLPVIKDEIFDLLDNQQRQGEFTTAKYEFYEPTLEFNEQVEVCSNLAGFIGGLKLMKDWLVEVNTVGRSMNDSNFSVEISLVDNDTVYLSVDEIDSLFLLTSDLYSTGYSINQSGNDIKIPIETISDFDPLMINVFGFNNDSIVAYQSVISQFDVPDTLSVELPDTLIVEGFVFDTLEYQVFDEISGMDITYLGEVTFDSSAALESANIGTIIGLDSLETFGLFVFQDDTTILTTQIKDPLFYIQLESDSLLFPENANTASVSNLFTNIPESLQNSIIINEENAVYEFSIREDSLIAFTDESIDYEDPQLFDISFQYQFRGQDGELFFMFGIQDVNESPLVNTDRIFTYENPQNGFFLGHIQAEDPEENELFYSLIGGNEEGSYHLTQDGRLFVEDSTLLDFELNHQDILEFEVTDSTNSVTSSLEVTLWDINEVPYDIILSADSVIENRGNFELVGTIEVLDQDFEDYFQLTVTENVFLIENNELRANVTFDYETTPVTIATISAIDQGQLSFTKEFEIRVIDVDEYILKSHPLEGLSVYPNPSSTLIYLQSNEGLIRAELYDSNGSYLQETEESIFSIADLSPGVYLLKVWLKNGLVKELKLVKE